MFRILGLLIVTISTVFSVDDPVVVEWIKGPLNPWNNETKWDPLPIELQAAESPSDAPVADSKGGIHIDDLSRFFEKYYTDLSSVTYAVKHLGKPSEIKVGTGIEDRIWKYEGKCFRVKGNKDDPTKPIKEYGILQLTWSFQQDATGRNRYFPNAQFLPFE